MNLSPIHQSPADKLALSSQGSLSLAHIQAETLEEVNQKLADLINTVSNPAVLRKLEEVKSAALIANQELKKINKKEVQKMEVVGAQLVTIKGDRGEKGDTGKNGKDGKEGRTGKDGKNGRDGKDGSPGSKGLDGKPGRDGENGKDGIDGTPGKDGSLATPDEVVEKINKSKKRIEAKQIRGLPELIRAVDNYGSNPQGTYTNVGGANPLVFQDSTGARISDYVTTVKLASGLTGTASSGTLSIVSTSSGGITTLSATETPNGNITVFTFSAATAQPSYIISDNVWLRATTAAGTVNWTWASGTLKATLTIPPSDEVYAIV